MDRQQAIVRHHRILVELIETMFATERCSPLRTAVDSNRRGRRR